MFLMFAYIFSQVIHLGIQAFVCLSMMHLLRPGIMEKAVFTFAMGYLCFGHIYRLYYDYGGYTLDITGLVKLLCNNFWVILTKFMSQSASLCLKFGIPYLFTSHTFRHLRSAGHGSSDVGQLDVPRVRLLTCGGHTFCYAGPSALNALLTFLKNSTLSLSTYRRQLKHFYLLHC